MEDNGAIGTRHIPFVRADHSYDNLPRTTCCFKNVQESAELYENDAERNGIPNERCDHNIILARRAKRLRMLQTRFRVQWPSNGIPKERCE